MPGTSELTKKVLRVDDYTLHTNHSFVRAAPEILGSLSWRTERDHLKSLLQFVRGHCQTYFDSEKNKVRDVNYEDLFFALNQLREHLSEDYENPAIEPFVRAVLDDQPGIAGREHLKELSGLACSYIQDVVTMELSPRRRLETLNHLGCLVDAALDHCFEGCDVFTLNHDLLIESTLEQKGIALVDGFGPPDGDVAWWLPEVFDHQSRYYFLKLHGSVNWVEYNQCLAKSLGDDPAHAQTADGKTLAIPGRSARVLLGTFNKIRDYFMRPYFDLMVTFRRQMNVIDTVIVSGYSFRDKGVNTVLTEWMRTGAHRNILILHERGNQCVRDARGAIRRLWKTFGKGRMRVHSEHLNACDWRDLVKRYGLREADPN